MIRIAFAGFRHDHIFDLYLRARDSADFKIVGACELDDATRHRAHSLHGVQFTHQDHTEMLDRVDCDAVAIGDYYAKRGEILVAALQRGKHVLSDKPLCTSLDEIVAARRLAQAAGLEVGCMLDCRGAGPFIGMQELVRGGAIGEVHSVCISGQHPLLIGSRAGWYFEEGKHGGTINDIGIHAFDMIEWITGLRFVEIVAARSWNAMALPYPHFRDGGQFLLRMSNGCGVMGDVSYFAPDDSGYSLDQYWRIVLHGSQGVAEVSLNSPVITVAQNGQGLRRLPVPESIPGRYLDSFVRCLQGKPREATLKTDEVFRAAQIALQVQNAADERLTYVALEL